MEPGKLTKVRASLELDCRTVSSFAGRLKIHARSSNEKVERGNERTNGSEKEWGRPRVHFLLPVSHLMNALGFSISRRTEEETVLQFSLVPVFHTKRLFRL